MPGIRRLSKSVKRLDIAKENVAQEFPGLLGVWFKDNQYVEVPGRSGYVYVRLRSNLNEVIQAYNSTVSPVYDLPVTITRDKTFNRYIISGRDLGRYGDWGTSPYLPRHGAQHSFGDENFGGDIVWVYDRQFMPLSLRPSGSAGANNAFVEGDVMYWDGEWGYAGGTGTPDMFAYKPTGAYQKLVLVYIDSSRNPALLISDPVLDVSATGISQIIPYLPNLSTTQGVPIGAVRLQSGTERITWREIYDLRPLLNQANWASPYQVQDEGVTLPRRSYMNFKGAMVWAEDNAGDDSTDISFSGTSAQDGHTIMQDGVPYTQRENLNFIVGGDVAFFVRDNAGLNATEIVMTGTFPWPGHMILNMPTGSATDYYGDEVFAQEDFLDFRGNIVKVTDAEESAFYATEVNVSGTQVLQSSSDPSAAGTGTFPGIFWLKPYT